MLSTNDQHAKDAVKVLTHVIDNSFNHPEAVQAQHWWGHVNRFEENWQDTAMGGKQAGSQTSHPLSEFLTLPY